MSYHLSKLKGVLFILCVIAAAGSHIFFAGIDDGIAAIDREALDSYVHFAKQMHQHKVKPSPAQTTQASTVWDAVDAPAKKHR